MTLWAGGRGCGDGGKSRVTIKRGFFVAREQVCYNSSLLALSESRVDNVSGG